MLEIINYVREQIKLSNNRSYDIRYLSGDLLKLAYDIFNDAEHVELSNKLYQYMTDCIKSDNDLLDLAEDIHYDDSNNLECYSDRLLELDKDNKLEELDSYDITDVKSGLLLKILLLYISKPVDEDYSREIVHEKIYDNLRNECCSHNDIWKYSIYGSGLDDGTNNIDKYSEPHDPFSIEQREITKEFITKNYCGWSQKFSDSFCNPCKTNFMKIADYMDKLEVLVD